MKLPKTIYTTAIPGRNPSIYGGTIWECPKCGYFPGASEVPHIQCRNCNQQLVFDEPNDDMLKIDLVPTDWGWDIKRPEIPDFTEDYIYDAFGRRKRVW